jgi:hypothetical protein
MSIGNTSYCCFRCESDGSWDSCIFRALLMSYEFQYNSRFLLVLDICITLMTNGCCDLTFVLAFYGVLLPDEA